MKYEFPYWGFREECNEQPLTFPPQLQDRQPGIESIMTPRPVYDDPDYIGSGKLKGKVALITGGDSGIGRAAAVAFAKEGADVAVAYYDEHEDADETKEVIEAYGGRCLLLSGDLREECFCKKLICEVVQVFGGLDVLVNNAGVQFEQEHFEDITTEQMELTYRVNVFPMFHLIKAALPHLREGSAIINTTSVTAYLGNDLLMDYSSTKGAIVSLTRALARSLADKGIRVNAVAPGPVWTPLQPASWRDEEKIMTFGADTPMKRAGQPVELGPTYVYLASNDSTFVTGQVLHVDGGQYMSS